MSDAANPPLVDPRQAAGLNALLAGEAAILPQLARPRAGLSRAALLGLAGVAAVALFAVLEARRQNAMAPAVQVQASDQASGSRALPPLATPYWWDPAHGSAYVEASPSTAPANMARPVEPTFAPSQPAVPRYAARPAAPPMMSEPAYSPPPSRVSPGSPLVDGRMTALSNAGIAGAPTTVTGDGAAPSVRAAKLAGPSTTVPQGWLIPATLETALDSTRPGFARAIVSRPVYGFDGTRILIPRGSRLFGEYGSETALGQKRALIRWTRLIRPDGVTIALDSPATDTLGRGGVKAKVNSHFFARFAGAILQSALNIGENIAAREAGSSVVVALPGAQLSGLAQTVPASQITPTLSVKPGTRVSVFVARDLDFADFEPPR